MLLPDIAPFIIWMGLKIFISSHKLNFIGKKGKKSIIDWMSIIIFHYYLYSKDF